jgi:excisionase family DNA binding protein
MPKCPPLPPMKREPDMVSRISLSINALHPTHERELLDIYLSLAPDERKRLFASTAVIASNFEVSQRTLQRWIEEGSILAIRVGGKYQVYLPAVERYIAKCNAGSIPENIIRLSRK